MEDAESGAGNADPREPPRGACLGALVTVRAAPAIPKLLIDMNVVLDVILERKPWVEDATALLDAIAKGRAEIS